VGSTEKLEKAKMTSLLEPPEGTKPCRQLDFKAIRSISDF
jgi:hypothetical protein